MRWQVRCAIDRIKGLVPAQDFLRSTRRRICGFQPDCGRDRYAIEEGLQQVAWVKSACQLRSARVLEIGSGWQPLIPILFHLAGAGEVLMTDVKRLCHATTFDATLDSLRLNQELIARELDVPAAAFEELRRRPGETLDAALKRLSLTYLAPFDITRTGLPDHSLDVMVSRATLEHIPPEIIRQGFREAARVLRPGGVMCHFVDTSDHWEHRDKSILRINFLKYSDRAFARIQWNGLNYQNRLRHPEFARMLRETGFEVRREERNIDQPALRALASFPVAPRFREFSKEDLATVDAYFLAVKPGS